MHEYTVASPHDSLAIEPTVLKVCSHSTAGLFVINVCASKAPLTLVNAPGGFKSYKFYQVSRIENGIRHYRLRLGFFVTDAQAEAALARIREHFPAAFISRLYETSGRRAADDDTVLTADSTQTMRALTQPELENPNQPTWYVVQLAESDQPVNLDAMPHLDVFSAYRLYSVARQSSPKYSLRLGFFREEVSANVICGYLKTFFTCPSVVRVSVAEQTRFDRGPNRKSQLRRSESEPSAKVVYLNTARELTIRPVAVSTPAKSTVASPSSNRKKTKSLAQELLEEARQIEMAKSGKHPITERTGSWLSRLVGRSK